MNDKILCSISLADRKCFVLDYRLKYKNGELYLDELILTNNEDSCLLLFGRKSAEKIAELIERLYNLDVVVEEV